MHKQEIYQAIQQYFVDKPVQKIQVFGSYARNDYTERSDIDILLTFSNPVGLFTFFRYQADLEQLLKMPVDLGTPASISPYLWKYIENDLETIYEK